MNIAAEMHARDTPAPCQVAEAVRGPFLCATLVFRQGAHSVHGECKLRMPHLYRLSPPPLQAPRRSR